MDGILQLAMEMMSGSSTSFWVTVIEKYFSSLNCASVSCKSAAEMIHHWQSMENAIAKQLKSYPSLFDETTLRYVLAIVMLYRMEGKKYGIPWNMTNVNPKTSCHNLFGRLMTPLIAESLGYTNVALHMAMHFVAGHNLFVTPLRSSSAHSPTCRLARAKHSQDSEVVVQFMRILQMYQADKSCNKRQFPLYLLLFSLWRKGHHEWVDGGKPFLNLALITEFAVRDIALGLTSGRPPQFDRTQRHLETLTRGDVLTRVWQSCVMIIFNQRVLKPVISRTSGSSVPPMDLIAVLFGGAMCL